MSGIAGIIRFDGAQVRADQLTTLMDRLTQSGEAPRDTWRGDNAGLGQCALKAAPGAAEKSRALVSGDRRWVVTADARIDNQAELAVRLNLGSISDQTLSDAELILAAYQTWGEACCDKLLGDFAFSIWDVERQELFCARDYFGVKPFYYSALNQAIIFGSDIGALLALEEVPHRLNEVKIADFLLGQFEDKSRTFYQDIVRLPPAHWLKFNRGGRRVERYWALDPQKELRFKSEQEYAEGYRQHFVEAVWCRLRGPEQIGSMLSGGLDSSSVTSVAGQLLTSAAHRPLHTFSIIFDSVPQSDERDYMQTILAGGRYTSHFIGGDLTNPLSDMSEVIAAEAEPFYSPQLFLNRSVWAQAQQAGVGVLLDGLVGDNVISHGYPLLNQWAYEGRWISLWHNIRRLAAHHPDPAPVPGLVAQYIWREGLVPRFPRVVRSAWRAVRRHPNGDQPSAPAFINSDFAERAGLADRLQERRRKTRQVRTAHGQHYQDLEDGLIPTAMELYHRGSARFGLEPRFPFLDRRLVEFCLAIPPEQKLRHGYTRWVARLGMAGYLPEKIRWRSTKGDLGWNFVRGMQADRDRLKSLLAHDSPAANYLDMRTLQVVGERVGAGQGTEEELLTTFLAAELVLWFEAQTRLK